MRRFENVPMSAAFLLKICGIIPCDGRIHRLERRIASSWSLLCQRESGWYSGTSYRVHMRQWKFKKVVHKERKDQLTHNNNQYAKIYNYYETNKTSTSVTCDDDDVVARYLARIAKSGTASINNPPGLRTRRISAHNTIQHNITQHSLTQHETTQ